jgi:hypothetical protein
MEEGMEEDTGVSPNLIFVVALLELTVMNPVMGITWMNRPNDFHFLICLTK